MTDSPIFKWRTSLGKSQKALGKMLGVEQATICRYENGTAQPSPTKAVHIEKISKGLVLKEDLRPDVFGAP